MIQPALCALLGIASVLPAAGAPARDDSPRERARAALEQVLREDHTWSKVHAAEVLVRTGEAESIRTRFLAEAPQARSSPYRIGIWRILAETAPTGAERDRWTAPILAEALDPAPDPSDPARRLRAIESLGKLGVRLGGAPLGAMRRFAASAPDDEAPLPLWVLALAGEPGAPARLASLLSSPSAKARLRAAYALRWLRPADPAVREAIRRAADSGRPGGAERAYVLAAALGTGCGRGRMLPWLDELRHLPASSSPDAQYEAARALMPYRDADELRRQAGLLGSPDANTRVGAAWTILSATPAR
jgi:hypothetical protein